MKYKNDNELDKNGDGLSEGINTFIYVYVCAWMDIHCDEE